MKPATEERLENLAIGRTGEDLACQALEKAGYEVLVRNARAGRGETDVIAWDGGTLCFVEVRTRETTDCGHPLETIGPEKRRRLIKAAGQYMEHWDGDWPPLRFDAVGVVMANGPVVTLVKEAFEA